ncbi:hypothetical protein AtubIFM55763_001723 [Aspergillus tubingensis]|nr:hypothetical protein AtubIFM55763_001723 [Aspergillus tubingensis]
MSSVVSSQSSTNMRRICIARTVQSHISNTACSLNTGIIQLLLVPSTNQDLALVIGENHPGSDTEGTVRQRNWCKRQVDHGDSNALEQQLEAVFKIDKHFGGMLRLDEIATFME